VGLGSSGKLVPLPGREIKVGDQDGDRAAEQDELDEPGGKEWPRVPELGADTLTVLARLGFGDDQLAEWLSSGVILTARPGHPTSG